MIDKKLREAIYQYGEENGSEIHLLNNPSFDGSIIGISSNHQVVYDYEKMIEEYVTDANCSISDAIDCLDYNIYGFGSEYERHKIVILNIKRDELKEKF